MKVQIRKLQSNHDNLSKDVYTGYTKELPTVSHFFEMDREYLHTTKVTAVRKVSDKEYSFGTNNSLYFLTVLDESDTIPST